MESYEGNERRERGQYMPRNYSCYLFVCGVAFFFFFLIKATPDSLVFTKKHHVLINSGNTELFVEPWHF